MATKNLRARLATDGDVGAGNVLTTLLAWGERLAEPVLTFDTACGGHAAWEPLTTSDLDRLTRARAAALRGLGIRRRDPVAVCAATAADTALTFLALTRLGAIPALINPGVAVDYLVPYLTRLRAVGLITDRAHAQMLAEHDTGTPLLADFADLAAGDPDAAGDPYVYYPSDPVAITHSSGTTGVPKAVVHSHASLFAAIRYRLALPRPQGSERMLSAMPPAHAAGIITINLAIANGGEALMLSGQDGTGTLAAIERWRPRSVIGFSATWPDLVKAGVADADVSSVALWWNTGDCAHESHIRQLVSLGSHETLGPSGRQRVSGSVFVDGLGSSEMGHSHFHIAHTPQTNRYGRCIGRPHSFAEVAVFGPDGEQLPAGEIGELGTRSPTLSLGYWNDSAATYRTRFQGYFLTGDLVYRDEEGYYYHLDRKVDTIDLGNGSQLHTAASEEAILRACPQVLDCTVVAVPQATGRVVTDVLVQLAAGADRTADYTAPIAAALEPAVAATLREVRLIDDSALPFTATGKVRKFVLRERHRAGASR